MSAGNVLYWKLTCKTLKGVTNARQGMGTNRSNKTDDLHRSYLKVYIWGGQWIK